MQWSLISFPLSRHLAFAVSTEVGVAKAQRERGVCGGESLQARVKLNNERGKAAGESGEKRYKLLRFRVNLLASGKSWTLHVMNHER